MTHTLDINRPVGCHNKPELAQLIDYLVEMSVDPSKLSEFQRDPQRALDGTGISSELKAILATRDPLAIRRALMASDSADEVVVVHDVEVVVLVAGDEATASAGAEASCEPGAAADTALEALA